MRIALASPRVATSIDEGLDKVRQFQHAAAEQGAEIVCFPEAWLPGLRGQDFDVLDYGPAEETRVLEAASRGARECGLATLLCLERHSSGGAQIAAVVIDDHGEIAGCQTKNQLDPSEDRYYVPGTTRSIFETNGVKFGIAICHEGWRYPETVRWAATRGAKIVFHPQHTGNEKSGVRLTQWGAATNPYYEHAMVMRANTKTTTRFEPYRSRY